MNIMKMLSEQTSHPKIPSCKYLPTPELKKKTLFHYIPAYANHLWLLKPRSFSSMFTSTGQVGILHNISK